MKRTFWLTAAAVALVAAVSIPLVAQQAQGRGGRGPGMGMGPGGGRGGPIGMLRGLDLTEAQRQQIKTIHDNAREAEPPQAAGAALQKQLQLAILADTVDAQKIEELKTSIAAAEASALARRIDIETRVAQVLTPEQRAKARQALEQGPDRRQPRQRPGSRPRQ